MNDMEFSFGPSDWELALDRLKTGDVLQAAKFLALLEGEQEDALEEALALLEHKHITLCVDSLPLGEFSDVAQQRLQWEQQLVQKGDLPESLPKDDPLRLYLEEIAAVPAAGDPQLLAEQVLSGDTAAAQMLSNVTISRAIDQAKAMTGRGVLLTDLIQEASLGMWQGILAYTGGEYAPHIDWWISQYLAAAVTRQARANGVGMKLRSALESYRAADHSLLTKLGRNPTVEEIALKMQVSVEEAQVYEEMVLTARTLEKAKKPQQQQTEEDDQAVENTAYFQSRQRIDQMLSCLTEIEAKLVTLRFGLDGNPPCDLQQTAQQLSMTAQEVVEAEAKALAKMRNEE